MKGKGGKGENGRKETGGSVTSGREGDPIQSPVSDGAAWRIGAAPASGGEDEDEDEDEDGGRGRMGRKTEAVRWTAVCAAEDRSTVPEATGNLPDRT